MVFRDRDPRSQQDTHYKVPPKQLHVGTLPGILEVACRPGGGTLRDLKWKLKLSELETDFSCDMN